MPARNLMVRALFNELLGPRNGPNEHIDNDPKGEYIVGLLEPKDFIRGALVFYGRSDFQTIEAGVGEDDDTLSENDSGEFDLQLDPRALPKSMGISFIVKKTTNPTVALCATWARYIRDEKGWIRKPNSFVGHNINLKESGDLLNSSNERITYLSSITSEGNYYVSIYLINKTPLQEGEYPKTEHHIFQPQLRIVCENGTEIVPILGDQEEETEESSLTLLFREKRAKARGHLCGATWKKVDPEQESKKTNKLESNPFQWIDKDEIKGTDSALFSNPDVRTEYLPCYFVQQFEMEPKFQTEGLNLHAKKLSETWDANKLLSYINPIPEEYKTWISTRFSKINNLKSIYKNAGERHLNLCLESERRIREGIHLIKENQDVRLAFCFMNKVMERQSQWRSHRSLVWRPFQMAFILQCLKGIVMEDDLDRSICDVLWFPTGGGKTEAYLGLAIFVLALRRRIQKNNLNGGGTGVFSRYTLRMLTIQQFRRALFAITACDFFRVSDWRPNGYSGTEKMLWGKTRFSIGLWVGSAVTPNRLIDHTGWDSIQKRQTKYPGAISRLMGFQIYRGTGVKIKSMGETEPAQIMNCPACDSILAVPKTGGLSPKNYEIHFIVQSQNRPNIDRNKINAMGFQVLDVTVSELPNNNHYVLSLAFSCKFNFGADHIDRWWRNYIQPALGSKCKPAFARASRPGYFLKRWDIQREPIDFEIHCPNPSCELNQKEWFDFIPDQSGKQQYGAILPPFQIAQKKGIGYGIPISGYVVDDQIFHRCPSMIVATVDKFARLPFEPRAAALFGNVNKFDSCWGYYRDEAPPDRGKMQEGNIYSVPRFEPPELIIQDELHLIEGPLGSMVGIYETAIENLSGKLKNEKWIKPKYVASSATIRNASSQVQAIFDRKISIFPAPGILIDDNFFSHVKSSNPLGSTSPGRLYLGVCAPGRGPQTPTIRIWTALLREAYKLRLKNGADDIESDQFWTIVGYFNAIRELAAALGLFRADIRERIRQIGGSIRPLDSFLELSSRMESSEIPTALKQLSTFPDNHIDAVFSTSMFGTGVDVDRLGLMIVHGQPKTTANYIQATGRVGRKMGGLVVTFLRATRPRDLDHYEFFVGYHQSLARFVEPITVHPFSPRARERALGPVAVALLRNAETIFGEKVSTEWVPEDRYNKIRGRVIQSGSRTITTRWKSPEVEEIFNAIEKRSQNQPFGCRPPPDISKKEIVSEFDKWKATAKGNSSLIYYEPTLVRSPTNPVVLGDPQHYAAGLPIVFRNVPQSLREVESTTTFEG